MKVIDVAIGLGSNLGDRAAHLAFGLKRLADFIAAIKVSTIYETEPVGETEQPRFLNAVAVGRTQLGPHQLLSQLHDAERAAGRRRDARRYGPRTLDLDLLLYGSESIDTPELVIPHPRLVERAFVLVPLAEVAPDWPVPGTGGKGETVVSLLSRIEPDGVYPVETGR